MSLVGFKAANHPQQVARDGADDATDDMRTPPEIFTPLDKRHFFTIDAASSHLNALLPRHWTKAENALLQSWDDERVWCNPPYSNLTAWVKKADAEMRKGTCSMVCMLLPSNRTEQKWWQTFIEPYRDREPTSGILLRTTFLSGRPRFIRPGWVKPVKGDRPPFGLVVCVWQRLVGIYGKW